MYSPSPVRPSISLHVLLANRVPLLGSAVAVECVFSRGRDTISLRQASLAAETIRALMVAWHAILLQHGQGLKL
jgi:hypothetical protein